MHSEHLSNLHPGWAVGGWLVSVAVTSVFYLGMVGIGLLPVGAGTAVGAAVAMAIGFYAGGLFVGFRWSNAPILHGAAITGLSIVVWFLGSLASPGSFRGWANASPVVPGIILLQFLASAAGGWTGHRMAGDSGDVGGLSPLVGGAQPQPCRSSMTVAAPLSDAHFG